MSLLVVFYLFSFASCSNKDNSVPDEVYLTFEKLYGMGYLSWATSIDALDDGYIIAGTATSPQWDVCCSIYLVRTDLTGNELWATEPRSGGVFGSSYGVSVQQTGNGGFVFLGYDEESKYFIRTAFLEKFDDCGETEWRWTGTMGSEGIALCVSSDDTIYSIIRNDTEYLLCFDDQGHEQWRKPFPGMKKLVCPESGPTLAGLSHQNGGDFVRFITADKQGNVISDESIHIQHRLASDTLSLATTNYQGYIMATTVYDNAISLLESILLIKTDHSGNPHWMNTFGQQFDITSSAVQQTSDGGFILSGTAFPYSGYNQSDIFLMKIGINSQFEWFTLMNKEYARTMDVKQSSDEGYVIVGRIDIPEQEVTSLYFAKTDPEGRIE